MVSDSKEAEIIQEDFLFNEKDFLDMEKSESIFYGSTHNQFNIYNDKIVFLVRMQTPFLVQGRRGDPVQICAATFDTIKNIYIKKNFFGSFCSVFFEIDHQKYSKASFLSLEQPVVLVSDVTLPEATKLQQALFNLKKGKQLRAPGHTYEESIAYITEKRVNESNAAISSGASKFMKGLSLFFGILAVIFGGLLYYLLHNGYNL